MPPTVGFLVLAYNYGRFLPECLASIAHQSHADWEAWILDDASTDDTAAVAARFANPRFHYVRRPVNLGLTANCNDGLARSAGRYVWIISADDALHDPDALGRAVAVLESDPEAGLVWSAPVRLGGAGERLPFFDWGEEARRLPPPALSEALVDNNRICAPGGLARRSLYDQVCPAPAAMVYALDWYFWFRFGLLSAARYLPQPLARYRIHEQNMTHANGRQPLHGQFRDQLALRLWMQSFAAAHPRIAGPARECNHAELRRLFQHWTDASTPPAEVAGFLRQVAAGARSLTAGTPDLRPALGAALHAAAGEERAQYRRRRRPRAWWRAWRLETALRRALRSP